MNQMIPSIIMGFREGLEAFLLIAIILQYLSKTNQAHFKNKVIQGVAAGLIVSVVLGLLLNTLSASLGGVEIMTKVWESIASFIALALITFFIIWMIRHGSNMAKHIEGEVENNLSAAGLFLISLVVIAREGAEIAVFAFAGKYHFSYVAIGILVALIITILIFHSLIKINLSLLFKITLAYLVLQAGFLLGYAVHEGLSSLQGYDMISSDSPIFIKAFNVSETMFSHKDGVLGIPLHILFGWYSKPEWIQFSIQYLYTLLMLSFWYFHAKKMISNRTYVSSQSLA